MADVALEHDLVVISDEVYEHLVFDGREHIPISTLPGMAERTVTIGASSSPQTFTMVEFDFRATRSGQLSSENR